jgi:DNA-binding transcriptional ArsR family regulator
MRKNHPAGPSSAKGGHALAPAQLAAVAGLFGVLSEEIRLAILQRLKAGPASVGELVEELGMKQANVSKQLGILSAAGVIARRQDGNRAIYSIALPLVFDLCDLVCRGVAEQAASRAAALRSA